MTYRKLNNITVSDVPNTCEDCSKDPVFISAVELETYMSIRPEYLISAGQPYKCTTPVEKDSIADLIAEKEEEGYRIYASEAFWLETLIRRAGYSLDKLR